MGSWFNKGLLVCLISSSLYAEEENPRHYLSPRKGDDIKYIKPVKYEAYTFKYNGYKGFKLFYDITKEEYKGKMPEMYIIAFHGPQPLSNDCFYSDNKDGLNLSFVPDYSKYILSEGNLYNKSFSIVAFFEEPPEKYIRKWREIEIKVTGRYLDEKGKQHRLFFYETSRIKGIVGINYEDDNKYAVTIPKNFSEEKIKNIKAQVEEIAKKYNCVIIEWKLIDFNYGDDE